MISIVAMEITQSREITIEDTAKFNITKAVPIIDDLSKFQPEHKFRRGWACRKDKGHNMEKILL